MDGGQLILKKYNAPPKLFSLKTREDTALKRGVCAGSPDFNFNYK
jgi:hypothetical protein